jgi:hypothetical protein
MLYFFIFFIHGLGVTEPRLKTYDLVYDALFSCQVAKRKEKEALEAELKAAIKEKEAQVRTSSFLCQFFFLLDI